MAGSSDSGTGRREAGRLLGRVPPRVLVPVVLAVAGVLLWTVLDRPEREDPGRPEPVSSDPGGRDPHADFVGSQRCAECHQEQFQDWKDSTHGLAGGEATPERVIGAFEGTVLRFKDAVVRLSTGEADDFWFEVDVADQPPRRFRADYVVGAGLMHGGGGQNYFSEFPDGTIRLLPFEWSGRDGPWFVQTKDNGWQPVSESISIHDTTNWPPYRVLGNSSNFVHNCQNCHGSQLTSTYDPVQKQHATRFTSLSINCESCHGPGRRHVELASNPDRAGDADIGLQSLAVLDKDASINVCLQCHAVKQKLTDEPFLPGMDFEEHFTTKIHTGFSDEFHPDGRVKGFLYQKNHLFSDCYLNGSMTCVDCHEPHSLHYRDIHGTRLVGKFDDRQCTSCHAAKAENPAAHTFHQPDSAGSRCTSCHMPFLRHPSIGPDLGFDRSDHTISIPRPAHDAALGVDNACAQCHREMTTEQLGQQVQKWYGPLKPLKPVVEGLLTATSVQDPEQAAKTMLHSGVPIAEVAAISQYLERFVEPDRPPSAEVLDRFRDYSLSPDLDVQAMGLAALHLVEGGNEAIQNDLDLLVRELGDQASSLESRRILALRLLAESWLEKGEAVRAMAAFRKAIELDAEHALATLGLAKSMLAAGREVEALPHLRRAAELAPQETSIQNNVGVYLVRAGFAREAAECFRKATEANRDDVQFLNNYANALARSGDMDQAVEVFQRLLAEDPRHARAQTSLGAIREQQGRLDEALAHYRAVEEAHQDDVQVLMKLVQLHWESRRAPQTLRLLKRAEPLALGAFGAADPRTVDIQQRIQFLENLPR